MGSCIALRAIVDDRQILVLHAQRARTGVGGFVRFADDEGDAVTVETHDVIAEQRLVGDHEPVAIVRHVFGGEHRDHARHAQRSAVVDCADARVRALREDDLQTQVLVADEVGRILCRAGHFPARIGAWQRLADHTRASAFAASLASIIASRILR